MSKSTECADRGTRQFDLSMTHLATQSDAWNRSLASASSADIFQDPNILRGFGSKHNDSQDDELLSNRGASDLKHGDSESNSVMNFANSTHGAYSHLAFGAGYPGTMTQSRGNDHISEVASTTGSSGSLMEAASLAATSGSLSQSSTSSGSDSSPSASHYSDRDPMMAQYAAMNEIFAGFANPENVSTFMADERKLHQMRQMNPYQLRFQQQQQLMHHMNQLQLLQQQMNMNGMDPAYAAFMQNMGGMNAMNGMNNLHQGMVGMPPGMTGLPSGMAGMAAMAGMNGMAGMPGMPDMNNMANMANMASMANMANMANMNGIAGMVGMNNMVGLHNMAGMNNMMAMNNATGVQGKIGASVNDQSGVGQYVGSETTSAVNNQAIKGSELGKTADLSSHATFNGVSKDVYSAKSKATENFDFLNASDGSYGFDWQTANQKLSQSTTGFPTHFTNIPTSFDQELLENTQGSEGPITPIPVAHSDALGVQDKNKTAVETPEVVNQVGTPLRNMGGNVSEVDIGQLVLKLEGGVVTPSIIQDLINLNPERLAQILASSLAKPFFKGIKYVFAKQESRKQFAQLVPTWVLTLSKLLFRSTEISQIAAMESVPFCVQLERSTPEALQSLRVPRASDAKSGEELTKDIQLFFENHPLGRLAADRILAIVYKGAIEDDVMNSLLTDSTLTIEQVIETLNSKVSLNRKERVQQLLNLIASEAYENGMTAQDINDVADQFKGFCQAGLTLLMTLRALKATHKLEAVNRIIRWIEVKCPTRPLPEVLRDPQLVSVLSAVKFPLKDASWSATNCHGIKLVGSLENFGKELELDLPKTNAYASGSKGLNDSEKKSSVYVDNKKWENRGKEEKSYQKPKYDSEKPKVDHFNTIGKKVTKKFTKQQDVPKPSQEKEFKSSVAKPSYAQKVSPSATNTGVAEQTHQGRIRSRPGECGAVEAWELHVCTNKTCKAGFDDYHLYRTCMRKLNPVGVQARFETRLMEDLAPFGLSADSEDDEIVRKLKTLARNERAATAQLKARDKNWQK